MDVVWRIDGDEARGGLGFRLGQGFRLGLGLGFLVASLFDFCVPKSRPSTLARVLPQACPFLHSFWVLPRPFFNWCVPSPTGIDFTLECPLVLLLCLVLRILQVPVLGMLVPFLRPFSV